MQPQDISFPQIQVCRHSTIVRAILELMGIIIGNLYNSLGIGQGEGKKYKAKKSTTVGKLLFELIINKKLSFPLVAQSEEH